jgi:hypothetical protein
MILVIFSSQLLGFHRTANNFEDWIETMTGLGLSDQGIENISHFFNPSYPNKKGPKYVPTGYD